MRVSVMRVLIPITDPAPVLHIRAILHRWATGSRDRHVSARLCRAGIPLSSATATSRPRLASASSAAPKSPRYDLARRLAEAIWHMLTREQPFAPKGATDPLAA
jgi:hypothetical protein